MKKITQSFKLSRIATDSATLVALDDGHITSVVIGRRERTDEASSAMDSILGSDEIEITLTRKEN